MGNRDSVHFSGHRRSSFHAFPVPMGGGGAGCLSAASVTITFPCIGFPVNGKRVFAVCRLVSEQRGTRGSWYKRTDTGTLIPGACAPSGAAAAVFSCFVRTTVCPWGPFLSAPYGAERQPAPRSALSTAADFDAAEGDRSAECISG